MNHETCHELLALRLYGEISPDEERLLEAHLDGCDACTAFASELRATLGELAERERTSTSELPAGWRERLRTATREDPAPRRLQPLAIFGAGLAAGLLVMASLRAAPPRPGVPGLVGAGGESITLSTNALGEAGFVARSTPPPRATGGGSLARLPALLRR